MKQNHETEYYFECHITFDPVFDEQLILLEDVVKKYNFKVAKLLMQKGKYEEISTKDTFMTGHSKNYDDISNRMKFLIDETTKLGYNIRRYKIENIVLDSRICDELNLLN